MGKKKAAVAQPIDSQDVATTFWFCMAALLPMLAMGMRMFTAMPYRPPLAKTDIYSGYRWARCDTNSKYCDREYNETTIRRVVPYTQLRSQCNQATEQEGTPVALYSTDPNEHFEHRRSVGQNWVYGRVARELDELRAQGIDPVRLESLLVSLAQTSSGNVGESIALKRPELEKRYWDQMKAFVHKYPEPDTGNVQELFKGWYKQDPDVYPPPASMPSLPAFGDFKWMIPGHSSLTAERYMSSVFYAGGYPWRMVYYPRAVSSEKHMSIYLTPAASQLSLPNWSRRVSYSVRVFGHEKPAMSIWANYSSCIFTANKHDNAYGFEFFTTHTLLETPGRGYLKNDVLEIRTIVRVDAVANMAPPPPKTHKGRSSLRIMESLRSFFRMPADVMSGFLGESGSKSLPCKWCSWKGGPSKGTLLPFGLKLHRTEPGGNMSLGHVYGDSTWTHVALYGLLDILLPCGIAIALCHGAAIPLAILDVLMGQIRHDRTQGWRWWTSVLSQARDAHAVLPSILALEGCLAQLMLTSLLSQSLLSRAGLLGLLCSQLCMLCLRCLQAHDLDTAQSSSDPGTPRSTAASSSLSTEAPPAGPPAAIWWKIFSLTVAIECLTNFGVMWELAVPLGLGLAMLKGECTANELLYFHGLPAVLVDCLCHSASHAARIMHGPLVIAVSEMGIFARNVRVWWAAMLPTEESLHASVCSTAAFICLACLFVPELRRDWKLTMPLLALLGAGPGSGVILAGVAVWDALHELPPGVSMWGWLAGRLTALPAAALAAGACALRWAVQPVGAAFLFLCRKLKGDGKRAPKAAVPKCEKKTGSADSKLVKRCTSTSPKCAKQKQAGQGRVAGSKTSKPKRVDMKPAGPAQVPASKGRQEQAHLSAAQSPCAFDATATITVSGASQKAKVAGRSEHTPSPTRPPLQPLATESNITPDAARTYATSSPALQPEMPAADHAVAGLSVQTKQEGTLIQCTSAPVTPPASDALPLPVGLLLGSQPPPAAVAVPATPALPQEQPSRSARPAAAAATISATVPIPAAVAAARAPAQCSPEDLLLAVLTGAPRGAPAWLAPPAARIGAPGPAATGLAGVLGAQPPSRVRPLLPSGHGRDNAGAEVACVMCWENPRQTTLAPCGHRALCAACTKLLLGQRAPALCPICRCGVQSYITREFDA